MLTCDVSEPPLKVVSESFLSRGTTLLLQVPSLLLNEWYLDDGAVVGQLAGVCWSGEGGRQERE